MEHQLIKQINQALTLPAKYLPVKNVLTALEVSDSAKAFNALNGKQVCSCENHEISQTLGNIFLLTGIKEKFIPCEAEENVLVYFIRVNYPNKTLDEFTLAFNLALTGKLELAYNDVKLYDIFSCEYLGRIMSAYAKWLKGVYYRYQEFSESQRLKDLPAGNVKLSEKQWNELLKDSNKLPFDLIPVMLYEHFTETKKIKVNDKDKWAYLHKATTYLDIYLRKKNIQQHTLFEKMKIDGFTGELLDLLRQTSKRLIIWELLLKKDSTLLLSPPKRKIKQLNKPTTKLTTK